MTVAELIAALKDHNPKAVIIAWDCYNDCESDEIELIETLSKRGEDAVMLKG